LGLSDRMLPLRGLHDFPVGRDGEFDLANVSPGRVLRADPVGRVVRYLLFFFSLSAPSALFDGPVYLMKWSQARSRHFALSKGNASPNRRAAVQRGNLSRAVGAAHWLSERQRLAAVSRKTFCEVFDPAGRRRPARSIGPCGSTGPDGSSTPRAAGGLRGPSDPAGPQDPMGLRPRGPGLRFRRAERVSTFSEHRLAWLVDHAKRCSEKGARWLGPLHR
jgi:hypothetical protein